MSAAPPLPFTLEAGGVRLAVRVTPRAKRDALAGIVADPEGRPALAIRLAAPPVEGAANKALVAFLAKSLGVPKSAVRLLSGETGRLKRVEVSGIRADALERWIAGDAP